MICILDKGVFKLRTVCHYCNQYYYPNFFHLFKKNLFIFVYLFLAALGLCCGARASHCGGFSCCGARALGAWASVVVARRLQSAGSVVEAHRLSCSEACGIIYYEQKRATTQTSLDRFLKRVDRIESSKEPEPVPSASGVSEIAACPPSPIADDPSSLPSPTSSLSSSQ